MRTVGDIGEFRLIERLTRLLPKAPYVVEGVGDDCAVVRWGDRMLLVSCDLALEGVHFRRSYARPEDIGWKTAAAALSDIAAMGGAPMFALVSLACPEDTSAEFVEDLFAGLANLASRFGVAIIGGDTTRSAQGIVVDMMVAGQTLGGHCLRRRGAQAGDLLVLTGHPGLAAAGLHALEQGNHARELVNAHQRPRPRIPEGQWLANHTTVHAMIDVSDGVWSDARHLADASGAGINIESARIPMTDELKRYCDAHKLDPVRLALTGGEDYELLFTMSPAQFERTRQDYAHEFRGGITAIGEVTGDWHGMRLDGQDAPFEGFDHFRGG